MKTPEQMAEEYAETVWDESELAPEDRAIERHVAIGRHSTKIGFLAGYEAAKDEDKAKVQELEANWKFCCEDKARLLNELAIAERAKDETNLPTPAKWISVKERLPEYDQLVLVWHPGFKQPYVASRVDSALMSPLYWWRCEADFYEPEEVITHWMPLPEPPKDAKE